jgi:hypothetical protein
LRTGFLIIIKAFVVVVVVDENIKDQDGWNI